MMNFEEISKKVKKFSKDTMVEVQKMNEVRQLNSKVNEEKRYLNKLYLEMGKKLYDKYKMQIRRRRDLKRNFARSQNVTV